MPTFTYTARGRDGKKITGTLTAENRQAVSQMLISRGLTAETVQAMTGAQAGKKMGRTDRKVKTGELLVFTRQLSTIVSAGLPLLQGLDILAEQTEDANFAAVIYAIGEDVESGSSFSEALRKYPQVFPDLYVSMVRAGEAGGDLDGVLLQLADYLEAMAELRRRIKSAMTYPVAALSLILLISAGLIVWVVPQFQEIFSTLGATLPKPTLILIAASNVLRSWKVLIVIAVFIGIIMAIRAYGTTAGGRYNLDALKLRIPVFGQLQRKVSISRFTRTLSALTRSGVAILQALEIVERTAGNEVFARIVAEAGDSVRSGQTLAEPLSRSDQFPPMVTRMIAVGEKTGALEQMLTKISDFYDSEVKATVDSLTSLIEPILIMMMGIIVGGIVLALFLPIFSMSQNIKK